MESIYVSSYLLPKNKRWKPKNGIRVNLCFRWYLQTYVLYFYIYLWLWSMYIYIYRERERERSMVVVTISKVNKLFASLKKNGGLWWVLDVFFGTWIAPQTQTETIGKMVVPLGWGPLNNHPHIHLSGYIPIPPFSLWFLQKPPGQVLIRLQRHNIFCSCLLHFEGKVPSRLQPFRALLESDLYKGFLSTLKTNHHTSSNLCLEMKLPNVRLS